MDATRQKEQEEQVVQFLQAHPNFFQHHLNLLDSLALPHHQSGTISLVEMQLERQRKRIKSLETELEILGQLARQQQDIFLALMPLQQQLSRCQSLHEGIQALDSWAKKFELQQAKILLFTDQWQKPSDIDEQYWVDRKAFELIRLERMGLRHFYLGTMTHKEKTLLFLPEEFPIASVACCLLGAKIPTQATALLLFTSRDAHQFHNGQDLSFLKHLVDIVDLHLPRWLSHYWGNI